MAPDVGRPSVTVKTLILSHPSDIHAHAVRWGLQQTGAPVDFFYFGDFPTITSCTFDADASAVEFNGPDISSKSHYDVIWNRRHGEVSIPFAIHESDRKFSTNHSGQFLNGIIDHFASSGFWVNPPSAAAKSERKVSQFSIAKAAGLITPRTIISNEIDRIREFLSKIDSAIVKPTNVMHWHIGDIYTARSLTARVSADDLSDLPVLACPMIYQEEVRKKYEIRAVVFGRDIVAVRLDSQDHPLSVLDWREPPPTLVKHTPIILPTELENALLKYMELSGLVHGSFDLAVDIEGNFIFFEVNQQGQFLWMEELCPEIALLDRAVDFMRQGHPLFKYNPEKSPGIRMEDYLVDPSGFPCRENFRSRHAPDPHGYSQPD